MTEVLRFLGGNFDGILQELEQKMQAASEELQFEKAIEYRELLGSVKKIAQKQKITDSSGKTGIFWQWHPRKKMRWYRCFLSGAAV